MALPARNLPVRILYAISMLTMVVFLGWEAWAPLSSSFQADYAQQPTTKQLDIAQPSVAVSQEALAPTRNVRALHIQGVSTRIYLADQMDWQIEEHWRRFAGSVQASTLKSTDPVFAIYTDYNSAENSVSLTLGPAGARESSTLTVTPGNYKTFKDSTVLEAWQSIDSDNNQFAFNTDFEQWQLDSNFQPTAVTAFIGLYQE